MKLNAIQSNVNRSNCGFTAVRINPYISDTDAESVRARIKKMSQGDFNDFTNMVIEHKDDKPGFDIYLELNKNNRLRAVVSKDGNKIDGTEVNENLFTNPVKMLNKAIEKLHEIVVSAQSENARDTRLENIGL